MLKQKAERHTAGNNDKHLALSLKFSVCRGFFFTIIELLIVISIIAVLAAMLLPALNAAREKVKGIFCSNNLKSTGMSILFYAQDNKEYFPFCFEKDRVKTDRYTWGMHVMTYMGKYNLDDMMTIRANLKNYNPPRDLNKIKPLVCPGNQKFSTFAQKSNSALWSYIGNYVANDNVLRLDPATGNNRYYATGFKSSMTKQPSAVGTAWDAGGSYNLAVTGYANGITFGATTNISGRHHSGGSSNILFIDGHVMTGARQQPALPMYRNAQGFLCDWEVTEVHP